TCIFNSTITDAPLMLTVRRLAMRLTTPRSPLNWNRRNRVNKTLRVGLLSASAIFYSIGLVLWGTGNALINPASLVLSVCAWLLGTLSAGLALVTSVPRRAVWLVLLACIAVVLHATYLNGLNYTPLTVNHTDNEMIGKYALEALKRGDDPYQWNFSD